MRLRFRAHPGAQRLVSISTTAACCLALALAAGCQANDLGSPCELARAICYANCDDPENADIRLEPFSPEDDRDFIATGVMDCEHFTCVSKAGSTPFCTRQCSGDDQCRGGVNPDLVCSEMVLDRDFLADLCNQLGPDECDAIFGRINDSDYCVPPE